ncbi:MAG: exodeoxyribonuclease VII large subunit, partial [Phycisphaerales bacterium]|nr:exodeoxyribonuclease VII large subunit [Phycisphaerales bacterium]
LRPVGAGALQRRYEAMCTELRGLGYFDPARKRPLPLLPRRIAVITSEDGAAIHDVVSTARQRLPAVGLLHVPVRVQGSGAAAEVARAIRWVDRARTRLGVDAILVTRGGGSMEDLWTFNERVVADATFACVLPVVAAIGHESDTTVIELVADRRSATPTQATMDLVPDRAALVRQVDHLADRVTARVHRRLDTARALTRRLAEHPVLRDPAAVIGLARERITRLAREVEQLVRARVGRGRTRVETLAGRVAVSSTVRRLDAARVRINAIDQRLAASTASRMRLAQARRDALEGRLRAVDPRSILRRGFSYTTTQAGAIVRSVAAVRSGDVLRTHVADGAIESVVGAAARRRRGTGGEKPDQMDLFGSGE